MTDIIDYIDSKMSICYPDFKFWGLAEIIDKSKDRFPVTAQTREKVCLDEDYDCVVWHREISANAIESEDFSFGLNIEKQFNVTIRTIVAYKVEIGEDFKFEFFNNFPYDINVSGYKFLETTPGAINLDHEAVVQEEQIHTQYNKHRICWNIFTLENEFQFVLCPDSSPCNNL